MPVINAGTRNDANIKGADYGASISLILDESDPVRARGCIATPTTRPGSCSEGHLTFHYGEEQFACSAGDVVIVPPGVRAQVHQRWSRTVKARVHPRQPHRHRRIGSSQMSGPFADAIAPAVDSSLARGRACRGRLRLAPSTLVGIG